ncbi:2OG-Fe(II) oxygenase [Thalassobaculum sp.]|uniref:2OG-Fe(II) oxygenase family protein n=1 Tax=Thalassobaculum sp. TaxID=2022740 RepID=UPI0032EF0CF7
MRFLSPGDFLPDFQADSTVNPEFRLNTLGGRRFVLAFIGSAKTDLGRNLAQALIAQADWLVQQQVLVYVVTADKPSTEDEVLSQLTRNFIVFWDHGRSIYRLFGMEMPSPDNIPGQSILRVGLMLVRCNLRLHAHIPATPLDTVGTRIREAVATLPVPEPERIIRGQAPVLLVPDVLSRDVCRRFVEHYEQVGGDESGFMRDIDGQTRSVLDPKKKRRKDVNISDPILQKRLRDALVERVLPEIRKAYVYNATRIERYVIGCYDETDRGFFGEHRDNVSKATSHRAFAVSINLNSEEYDGGELRFREYGPDLYKPDTGAAVVFSCSLLHEATPVTRGRRYVILPFLYDDRAAVQRSEGQKFLSSEPALRLNSQPAA